LARYCSNLIEEKQNLFEKYKLMTELISSIQTDIEKDKNDNSEEETEDVEIETTSALEIEDFNKRAGNHAAKDLWIWICDIF
jgi:hypothetical protein